MLKKSKISFISLPTGTVHEKRKKKRFKNFPDDYVGKFYRDLADNVDHDFLESYFCGRIANDTDIPSADVQKYILAKVILPKEYKQTLNIMWQKVELTMRAVGKSLIQ